MTLNSYKAVMLKDRTIVKVNPGQFFCWSETGKRMELWQEEPLRLLKYWHKDSVLLIVVRETTRNLTNSLRR